MSISNEQPAVEIKKRPVIKNVFGDPFKIDWPILNSEVEKQIVEKICEIISPVGKYRLQNTKQARIARKQKKESTSSVIVSEKSPSPSISSQFCFGLKEILRGLGKTGKASPFHLILACHEDIEATILLADVLKLAVQKNTLVCGLSKGTTEKLGLALGQKRVTCLGIKNNAAEFPEIIDLLEQNIERIPNPWIEVTSSEPDQENKHECMPVLKQTRIKRLRTFAPILSKIPKKKTKC
ncbi:RNase P and RNase MRP subunit [Basidiobolus ranarum]|uniref:RNase P and RNase MRP subunit n=1 Tax=Basidiobolus ranarum TaxID=34480 RepID=A0ABR2W4Q6_9FUNG